MAILTNTLYNKFLSLSDKLFLIADILDILKFESLPSLFLGYVFLALKSDLFVITALKQIILNTFMRLVTN
jgi:hypothetical protein